ncbi:hypothetical protein SCRDD08_00304 [Streptococcus cristatus]|uniref:Uncharacterized protein n=1 Tax=Streptococcus cristatus TaxID=45634 RepID=A0A139N4L9_STRCR|nr:hypothetical protein SCRDD08_00304 [Streptococcus cristatus]
MLSIFSQAYFDKQKGSFLFFGISKKLYHLAAMESHSTHFDIPWTDWEFLF